MKKLTSVLCMFLGMVLLLGGFPVAMAQTTDVEPCFANSFLLCVNCSTKHEYTLNDFPDVEGLYLVSTVSVAATETGYYYVLLMAVENTDTSKAKQQASVYGAVCENPLASDYADVKSTVELNYSSLELKVGETACLQVVSYSLARSQHNLAGIMFTVDPNVVDEVALVETEYTNWGISYIYGDLEEPTTMPWDRGFAMLREATNSKANQVSPLHSYYGKPSGSENIFNAMNILANQPGVVKAELVYEPAMYPAVMPSAKQSCSPKGIVELTDVNMSLWDCIVTAVQPGETVITVKVSGGGTGTATATCKVTVVEEKPPVLETPTDIPPTTPTDVTELDNEVTKIYTGTSYIYKYTAVSALHILRACVGKEVGHFAREYDVDANGSINAVDALWALQSAVGKRVVEWPLDYGFPE